ncbi:MAG: filamentous hemagglutinin N-terminal domain-containing protein, partial [Sulfuritalea sp.]|nr:filamentous hemagglutinin N-terminal domain-containing protein [Sulfuritalea sp.]
MARKPRLRLTRLSFALAAAFSSLVQANPLDPTVVAGSATFQSTANALTVTNANGTVINWKGFSIGQGEITRFIQPDAASQVLNRVTSGDPSVILGSLQSNGRVFLINQNGIAFGANAQIDVGGFVASSLGLSNADFLAGRLNFTQQAGAGSIINQGVIRTATGGLVALIAPNIENHGVINAPNGDVILAAGKSANLVDLQRPSIQVEVNAADNQALNVGQLIGRNIGIYAGAIRHSGIANANTASLDETGRVVFKAVGDTLVSGKVQAGNSAGAGGRVEILGDRVGLFDSASIDVSGVGAGGTALVGGNWQGKGPEQNASATYVGKDASIKADAIGTGDGGKVVVWADGTTRFYGSISARGGANGGNGGLVETSGKEYLLAKGRVDASAPAGKGGLWFLDPRNVDVQTVATTAGDDSSGGSFDSLSPNVFTATADNAIADVDQIVLSLQGGTSVTINTGSTGSQTGNITVKSAIAVTLNSGDATLTLQADGVAGGVSFNNAANNITASGANKLNFVSSGGGAFDSTGATITTNGGNVTLTHSTTAVTLGAISSGAGNLNVTAGGAITQSGTLAVTGTSGLTATGQSITLNDSGNNFGGTVTAAGTGITLRDAGGMTAVLTDAGNSTLTAAGALVVSGSAVDLSTTTSTGAGTTSFGATTVSGNLTVSSSGAVSQSGTLAVTGT